MNLYQKVGLPFSASSRWLLAFVDMYFILYNFLFYYINDNCAGYVEMQPFIKKDFLIEIVHKVGYIILYGYYFIVALELDASSNS